jgi:hypothetical protein
VDLVVVNNKMEECKMKSILIKRIKDEFGISSIAGRKLELYSFYCLVGFVTRMRNGEEIK